MASILKVTEITTPDGTGNITVSRPLSSVQLGGVLDVNGNYVQTEKGGDIASASPLVIDTDGDYFDVTGTTNFAAMTVAADRQFTLQFDGALVMTHHATNLDLPGEANITTAAGDVGVFQSTGANTVQCISYVKADGTAVVATAGVSVFVGQFTFDQSVVGTTAVSGVGFQPKAVIFFSVDNSTAETCWGVDDGTNAASISNYHHVTSDTYVSDPTYSIRLFQGSSDDSSANITTLGADGFTITNAKTGSPTTTIAVEYLAIG